MAICRLTKSRKKSRCRYEFDSVGQDEWAGPLRLHQRCLGAATHAQESLDPRTATTQLETQDIKQDDRRWRSFTLSCQYVLFGRLPSDGCVKMLFEVDRVCQSHRTPAERLQNEPKQCQGVPPPCAARLRPFYRCDWPDHLVSNANNAS